MLMIPKHAVLIHRQLNQSVELSLFIEDFLYIDTSLILLAVLLLLRFLCFPLQHKSRKAFQAVLSLSLGFFNSHCCIHLCARSFSQDVKSLSNSKSGDFMAALRITQSCL